MVMHYHRLIEFGPPMWQAEVDTELTLSALPATAAGQILLEYGIVLHIFKLSFYVVELFINAKSLFGEKILWSKQVSSSYILGMTFKKSL